MSDNVAAVVVTYNRHQLLAECLAALASQTYRLRYIYVVDNASTDSTAEFMDTYTASHPDIEHCRLPENRGGSGGFHFGIHTAFKQDHDWIWAMDDDAIPHPDALERLLEHKGDGANKAGALYPLIYGMDGLVQKYHHMALNSYLDDHPALPKNVLTIGDASTLPATIPLDASCFVGPLINRNVIKSVGLPEKDYFIFADDTEYTYRIHKQFITLLVPSSQILHKDHNPVERKNGRPTIPFNVFWKQLYAVRNTLLFKRKYLSGPKFILEVLKTAGRLIRKTTGIVIRDDQKYRRLTLLWRGFYSGINGRTGREHG